MRFASVAESADEVPPDLPQHVAAKASKVVKAEFADRFLGCRMLLN